MSIRFEVIFQSRNGCNGRWLDYCRETAPAQTLDLAQLWGNREADRLASRIGVPCRCRVENWSE